MDNHSNPEPKLILGRTLRRLLDRRLLAATVNVFYRPALSHVRNGIPPRAEVYRVLYREALTYARAHSDIWGVSVEELHARIPTLEHLRILAGDEHPRCNLFSLVTTWMGRLRTPSATSTTKQ